MSTVPGACIFSNQLATRKDKQEQNHYSLFPSAIQCGSQHIFTSVSFASKTTCKIFPCKACGRPSLTMRPLLRQRGNRGDFSASADVYDCRVVLGLPVCAPEPQEERLPYGQKNPTEYYVCSQCLIRHHVFSILVGGTPHQGPSLQ